MGKQRERNRIKSRVDELPQDAREMLDRLKYLRQWVHIGGISVNQVSDDMQCGKTRLPVV